jgi:hypothetical protein
MEVSIKKLLEWLCILFIAGYLFYLAANRGSRFIEISSAEHAIYDENLAEYEKCMSDHDYNHRAPTKCQAARIAVGNSWLLTAAARTATDGNYICGTTRSCSELLRDVFESWVGLGVLVAILSVCFCAVFRYSERGSAAAAFERTRLNREHSPANGRAAPMAYPYIANGHAVMVDFDPSYPTYPAASARQRLAAWIHGGQANHKAKLI